MKIKYVLSELEIKQAVAQWLRDNQGARLMTGDVTLSSRSDVDYRGSPGPTIVTATATVESATE